jgi:hypothetical protein
MYFVVIASGRSDGNSRAVADAIFDGECANRAILAEGEVGPFTYAEPQPDDPFIRLILSFIESGDDLVLASPVYWDGLSAQAKAFVDRFGDLLIHRRDLGLRLHGRKLVLLLTGSRPEAPPAIEEAMRSFCKHLAMHFAGCWYVCCPDTKLPEDLPEQGRALREAISASIAATTDAA